MNNFNLNSDLARIRYSYADLYVEYSGAEVKATSDKEFQLVPDFKLNKGEKPKFKELKEAFIRFKNLEKSSALFGANGFFEKADNEFKNALINGMTIFYSFENYGALKVLEDTVNVIVIPALSFCVGTFNVTGTKQTNDVFTSCGYMQFVNPLVQYTANINLTLPMLEKDSFFSESFNQIFETLQYGSNLKPEIYKKVENKDFDFFFNFQQIKETEFDNMFVSFKAKITTNQINKDASGSVSSSDIPLSVSGGMSVASVPRNIEIFGDAVVTVPSPKTNKK